MLNENTLQRFLDVQQSVYKTALAEIKSGRKAQSLDVVYIPAG